MDKRNLVPAVKLIKEFEGCRLHAYQDPVGVWTIGWGHTAGVNAGQVISQQEADALLMDEVREFAMHVEEEIYVDVTDNQFCAVLCFTYNVGLGALHGSTLLRELNSNVPPDVVAREFGRWVYAGRQVLPGLVRRRAAERDLFLT